MRKWTRVRANLLSTYPFRLDELFPSGSANLRSYEPPTSSSSYTTSFLSSESSSPFHPNYPFTSTPSTMTNYPVHPGVPDSSAEIHRFVPRYTNDSMFTPPYRVAYGQPSGYDTRESGAISFPGQFLDTLLGNSSPCLLNTARNRN